MTFESISTRRMPQPSTGLVVLSFASNGALIIERLAGWHVERVHLDPKHHTTIDQWRRVTAEIRVAPCVLRGGALVALRGHKCRLRPDLARDIPDQVF